VIFSFGYRMMTQQAKERGTLTGGDDDDDDD